MNDQPEDENVPTLLLRIEEAALRLGIGRTSMYRLIMTGDVESVHIGALHRVPAPCLQEYVDRLRHRDPDPAA
ncbi:MAG: helix-turn-helix domain-containing protein [Actinomycetota bacterium]|nr:helix-turn-helix domain-containing protein [Actinomycetota bacterium]